MVDWKPKPATGREPREKREREIRP